MGWALRAGRSVFCTGPLFLQTGTRATKRLRTGKNRRAFDDGSGPAAPTETSHRQRVVQSVRENALVRPGLSLCLKSGTLAIWRCPSIAFRAALRQRVRSVKSDARVARPRIIFQRQQSAFESVSAAPDERATDVFKSDSATRPRHLFFRRVGYERRLTVLSLAP